MRNRTFSNEKHAYDYLHGSTIMVDGFPVVVYAVEAGKLYYCPLDKYKGYKGKYPSVPLDHPSIDMNPVPLGFYAAKKEDHYPSYYLERGPYRQWRQGLTPHTCIPRNPLKNILRGGYASSSHFLYTTEMVDTILGCYLYPEDAHKLAVNTEKVFPFSRNFAVYKDYLLWKDLGEPVGEMNRGKPVLHEDFNFLTRSLKEDLNARRDS